MRQGEGVHARHSYCLATPVSRQVVAAATPALPLRGISGCGRAIGQQCEIDLDALGAATSAHPRGPAIMNNHATWLDLAGVGGSGWNQQLPTQTLIGGRRLDAAQGLGQRN